MSDFLEFTIEGTFTFSHSYDLSGKSDSTGWTKKKAEKDFNAFFEECAKEVMNKYGMFLTYDTGKKTVEER